VRQSVLVEQAYGQGIRTIGRRTWREFLPNSIERAGSAAAGLAHLSDVGAGGGESNYGLWVRERDSVRAGWSGERARRGPRLEAHYHPRQQLELSAPVGSPVSGDHPNADVGGRIQLGSRSQLDRAGVLRVAFVSI